MISRDPFEPQLDLSFEEPRLTRRVWPVRELVGLVRELVEQEYGDVWVEGEISNFRPAPSGHVYFTLKDADAQLPVVLFRRQAMLLRFRPEDGLHVLVRGRVSVYEQRGQMQLVAETMEPVGAGSLQLAFEQLKDRLKAEGLFDAARKRPLPAFPRTVGIVTSPTGAVIRDFLNIVSRRHSGLSVLLFPVSVQGDSAPAEVEAALAQLNISGLVDVIVLARGGGSLEDLAAFNSERVARAIIASRLPVVSAIGHETDFTIADFAADLRAPTPSAAAELATPTRQEVEERIQAARAQSVQALRYRLAMLERRLRQQGIDRAAGALRLRVGRAQQRVDDLGYRVRERIRAATGLRERARRALEARLRRFDMRPRLAAGRHGMEAARTAAAQCMRMRLARRRGAWEQLAAKLGQLSPLRILERGYAIVSNEGGILKDAAAAPPDSRIQVRLAQGKLHAVVEKRISES